MILIPISWLPFFLTVCRALYLVPFHLICKFTEQYTKEQQDTEVITGETSDLDTNVPEPSAEAIRSKDSVALSLLDDVHEILVQDYFPGEVHLDVTVEDDFVEGKDDSKKSTTLAIVSG